MLNSHVHCHINLTTYYLTCNVENKSYLHLLKNRGQCLASLAGPSDDQDMPCIDNHAAECDLYVCSMANCTHIDLNTGHCEVGAMYNIGS